MPCCDDLLSSAAQYVCQECFKEACLSALIVHTVIWPPAWHHEMACPGGQHTERPCSHVIKSGIVGVHC